MAKGNCASIDIDFTHVKAQLLVNSDTLLCKSFVGLNQVDLVKFLAAFAKAFGMAAAEPNPMIDAYIFCVN